MRNGKAVVVTVVLAVALVSLILVQAIAKGKKVELETRIAALEELLQFVTIDLDTINGLAGPHMIIEGANVHIRSGSGFTDEDGTLTGLGNLVVVTTRSRRLAWKPGTGVARTISS